MVTVEMLVFVFLFLLVASTFSQPPHFHPWKYITWPLSCSLPFTVHLETLFSNCSGTIIHERWVLTAARCMYNDDEVRVKDDEVKVLAGVSDFKRSRVKNAQERFSEQIIIHKRYIFDTLSKFDFALIQVSTPFNFSRKCVGKATIAAAPWPAVDNHSRTCISWGFGSILGGDPNTALKVWYTVPAHGSEACPCATRFQAKRLICSTEAEGVNLCRGDLGSSLVCYEGKNDYFPRRIVYPHPDEPTQQVFRDDHDDDLIYDENKVETDPSRLTVYGVAHMTIDKYVCGITRVPKKSCLTLPTYAAYMYLCPFNSWLRLHVPDLPENIAKCGLTATPSLSRAVLTAFLFVLCTI